MAHRRFGNVRRLPSGRYQARYTGPDGRQHSAPETYTSKADARAWLSTQEAAVRRGNWSDPTSGRITFAAYVERWWQAKSSLAESTSLQYRLLIKTYLMPTFGTRQVASMSPGDIRRWHDQLASAERPGPSTTAKVYRLLKHILATAVEDGIIATNPCQIRGAGQDRPAPLHIPTLEDALLVAESIDRRYRAMVLLAAAAGLRFGELAGLQRKHINPDRSTVRVEQQLAQVGSNKYIKQPKTSAGVREVHIPGSFMDLLVSHLDEYVERSPDTYVFTNTDAGWLDRNTFRNRKWLQAIGRAGVERFRIHDLRHLAATMAAESGVPLKSLMARLGHSSPRAALGYQHAVEEHQHRIADHIETKVRSLSRPQPGS